MGLGRTAADGGDVTPKLGRKSKLMQSPLKSEAHAVPLCQRWVVHTDFRPDRPTASPSQSNIWLTLKISIVQLL
jgi:hypothetical protein